MATYKFIDQNIGKDAPTATGTVQIWPLGMTAAAVAMQTGSADPYVGFGEFVYVKGGGTGCTAGALVNYPGFTASVHSAALSASRLSLAFAAGAVSATNVYGWLQVKGIVTNACGTNSDIAAGIPLYLESIAGRIGSVSSLGNQLQGVYAYSSSPTASNSVSLLRVQIDYPKNVGLTALQ